MILQPRYSARRNRFGFTLVELLVVIAIIGMLAALLMPAINSARESARQATCTNNQRQFGQAILQYATSKDYFPGYRDLLAIQNGTTPTPYAIVSWQMTLMPNMGKTDVYQAFQSGALGTVSNPIPYWEMSVCPSDYSGANRTSPWTSYVVNTGALDLDSTHPVTVNNINYYDRGSNGIFLDRARIANLNLKPKLSLTDIKDGQTNTLMISENIDAAFYMDQPVTYPVISSGNTLPTPAQVDTAAQYNCTERGTGFIWWDTSAGVGTSPFTPPPAALQTSPLNSHPETAINGGRGNYDPVNGWPTTSYYYNVSKAIDQQDASNASVYASRPASNHPGGVIVTFAGGNTRFVREDIDYPVYCLLMTSDGANATNPQNFTTSTPRTFYYDSSNHSWQKYVPVTEGSL